ncbi:MAG: F0F1 ATP synthase subunit gamma [Desulfomicrobium sp.]|jgi:F-type H+-transporting ATPase subunit gamma|nr:F0F1 ATP synthase subunit gamma [Pseudomonadota bacterium]MBV1714043.1 F0F1 ATP synthase subunit gamma [Desulfomicrobium sp.]MBU4571580.1 F0F1 ATP synthase subunit gamma [Pseudomonadota bacterium]MBU4595728.1 F0F1 ATP synthase subunit gamma [Pseudomonadota bacterium]MBV1721646.1 F0F1 ATP synthase subunit gamma [Desulfomicrobium sp.]
MASLRDIQNKIVGVKKTKQITKAMNMVASAKLRGAQSRIERFRPYADKFNDILIDLASRADASAHPLLEKREVIENVGIVLVTSDKGLCGSFNANLCNAANRLAKQKEAEGKTVKFICIGKKGRDFIRKTSFEITTAYAENMTQFDFQLASETGNLVIDGYLSGQFDEVHIVYGKFVNIAKQEATSSQILPAETPEVAAPVGASSEYIFEPSVEGLLAELLPRYVKVQMYRGLLDTSASEHAARMSAMNNATKNCDEMVGSLTKVYNKARQASITTQLMDIVGGAEALKG